MEKICCFEKTVLGILIFYVGLSKRLRRCRTPFRPEPLRRHEQQGTKRDGEGYRPPNVSGHEAGEKQLWVKRQLPEGAEKDGTTQEDERIPHREENESEGDKAPAEKEVIIPHRVVIQGVDRTRKAHQHPPADYTQITRLGDANT